VVKMVWEPKKEELTPYQERERKPVFRPGAGTYKITILTEPNEIKWECEGEQREGIIMDIKSETDNKEYTWIVNKGKTPVSLYGQLALLKIEKGQLAGEKISVLVQIETDYTGTKRRKFTIVEAVGLEEKILSESNEIESTTLTQWEENEI